jgi:uncharacterized membrane protein
MDLLTKKIARFLFSIPFAIFGLMHFTAGEEMTAMVPFPGAILWIYFTGGALVLASISILTKKQDTLASMLLGIMLILFVAIVHIPALMDGDQMALSGRGSLYLCRVYEKAEILFVGNLFYF